MDENKLTELGHEVFAVLGPGYHRLPIERKAEA